MRSYYFFFFFFSSRRRHTRCGRDWSSDVCSSDLVRSLGDASALFDAGADKISINSAAIKSPALIGEIAERFGSQAVIVAIDAKRKAGAAVVEGTVPAEVYLAGGRI